MERHKTLKQIPQLSLITIFEPFFDNSHIHSFKSQLAMDHAFCNPNEKIWIFWSLDMDRNVLEVDDQ